MLLHTFLSSRLLAGGTTRSSEDRPSPSPANPLFICRRTAPKEGYVDLRIVVLSSQCSCVWIGVKLANASKAFTRLDLFDESLLN